MLASMAREALPRYPMPGLLHAYCVTPTSRCVRHRNDHPGPFDLMPCNRAARGLNSAYDVRQSLSIRSFPGTTLVGET